MILDPEQFSQLADRSPKALSLTRCLIRKPRQVFSPGDALLEARNQTIALGSRGGFEII
ncbi:MAG: hypothetical protein H0X39_09105 [Actinobacteria bacterium]|nr:hypothetical protein [Actinomycetota bacterium]